MWHEYPIPCNFEKQKEIIIKLRPWIEKIETDKVIAGYCFDHYFSIPPNPLEPDDLRIRFEYTDESDKQIVERQLEMETKKYLPTYVLKERLWNNNESPTHIYQAYELGSRCAFLAWKLIESGRFSNQYFDNNPDWNSMSLQFQQHFNHGVMNSLGILKTPIERDMHILNLMDDTKTKSKKELIDWLTQNLPDIVLLSK